MKKYDVIMTVKGRENVPYGFTVKVEDSEHPRHKAVDLLCKVGWLFNRDNIKIIHINRVPYSTAHDNTSDYRSAN
jgi:hypothetical protein